MELRRWDGGLGNSYKGPIKVIHHQIINEACEGPLQYW